MLYFEINTRLLCRSAFYFLFVFYLAIACYSCKSRSSAPSSIATNNKNKVSDSVSNSQLSEDSAFEKQFAFSDLKTNFSRHSVPLDSIHDGGPGKNGIPALDFPEFIETKNAKGFLNGVDYGIVVQGNTQTKFYPFNILNWHEIVNDFIEGVPVTVTFCPLCGSSIVYERLVDGDTLNFGVSGKLYESNLLMFDDKTESLWSQALGEAVAGDYTGKKLRLFNSFVTSFGEVEQNFPDALILNPKTGFDRNYSQYPYADYLSNEELYFPVSGSSNRFQNKEMMYIVPAGKSSIAFKWTSLVEKSKAEINTPAGLLKVSVKEGIPSAVLGDQKLPGYFSFWFSWYAIHDNNGIVWDLN